MAEGKIYAFRLKPDDADDAEVMKWLKKQSRKRTMSKVIRQALRDAMNRPEDLGDRMAEAVERIEAAERAADDRLAEALARVTDNERMADAFVRLVDKLEAGGMSREQVADSAGVSADFMARMAEIRRQGQSGSLDD